MADQESLARLHYELIHSLIRTGTCPSVSAIAQELAISEAQVHSLFQDLASIHGVVLHPHACEPWIIHPFSLTPTLNWIAGETGSWWAPCIWCALGVAVLVGGSTRIHTRYGAESEPLIIDALNGMPARNDVLVHFAIPPARAWDNVHQHCSLVLPFHSLNEIDDWCKRHGVAVGEALPLKTVADLARAWYGSHADRHWRKWTVQQALEIFEGVGLTSEFWHLAPRQGNF